jgi:HK97 family phage portal protein
MTAEDYIRRIGATSGRAAVTNDTALRHSAVWACLRLRANLISTMPVDVYRNVLGHRVEVPKPPVLVLPGGPRVDTQEWLYSSQVDLDRAGNGVGLITEVHASGLPARIDLQPISDCAVVPAKQTERTPDGWQWRICGKLYYPDEVWHEKQYTVSGLPIGLSPVAYAAWSISEYLSIQDFALDWFGNGGVPAQHLKNTAKTLTSAQAQDVKDRYTASVQQGGLFVSGSDWELNLLQSEAAGSSFLEAKQYGIGDIARFFDCPGDLIDAAVRSGHITYASITERNLQLLIMHIGPAVLRRETALGKLTPKPRYVKLNSDALLRMDPKTRAEMLRLKIISRQIAPSEARALEDLEPFTPEQIAEFDHFWPPKASPATSSPNPQ